MEEQKLRVKRLAKKTAIVLLVGVIYYVIILLTGWHLPCVFYLIGGNYCPGCGITRMCMALVRLDFYAAVRNNAFVMMMLPVYVPYCIYRAVAYIKTGRKGFKKWESCLVLLTALLMVVFWILRNTKACAFLAPIPW